MSFYTVTARILLLIVFFANLISVGGGGLALPPFKNTPWLVTSTANVGLYGSCPTANIDSRFFALQENWADVQNQCQTIFVPSTATKPLGTLTPLDSYIVSGLHGAAILFALFALLTVRESRPTTSLAYSWLSFIFQAGGFGYATYTFYTIMVDLQRGVYQGKSVPSDTNTKFGIGLYISAGCVLFLMVTVGYLTRAKTTIASFQKQRWGP